MYKNQRAIENPELQPWVKFLSGLGKKKIKDYIDRPALEVPAEARALLERHKWATAARAICMRAPTDDPEIWRNAVPADRVPIVLTFNKGNSTERGYAPAADPAAEYNHYPDYKYIGPDQKGRHQFINAVTRKHQTKEDDVTVGHELIVLMGQGKFVSLYLGNDGKTKDLPAEFREVRLNTDLETAFKQVMTDIAKAIFAASVKSDLEKMKELMAHMDNYLSHNKRLLEARLN